MRRAGLLVAALAAMPALASANACSSCPAPLPPDQFCFGWPLPDRGGADAGPCPALGEAALPIEAEGVDARGAAIEMPFAVVSVGATRAGHCCYVVEQTPLCN
jgi:hypothetical protein